LVFDNGDKDLKKYMDDLGGCIENEKTLQVIMYQIFKGMAYCHKNKVLHRDMKPQNILFNDVIIF
jgi:serine/threonine protein kinase